MKPKLVFDTHEFKPPEQDKCTECGESSVSHYWRCEDCGRIGNASGEHPCNKQNTT